MAEESSLTRTPVTMLLPWRIASGALIQLRLEADQAEQSYNTVKSDGQRITISLR